MTPKEAIESLEYIRYCNDYSKCRESIALDMAITALGALEQIRAERDIAVSQLEDIGVQFGEKMDRVKEAMEKQIPKMVNKEITTSNAFTQWRKYNCPNCGCFLYSGASKPFSAQSHCHQCGQVLDWGDDE